jgi:hypothetical protein
MIRNPRRMAAGKFNKNVSFGRERNIGEKIMKTKFTSLDFSKSSDQAYAEKCFGGKEHWKNNYPLTFAAYEKAQKQGRVNAVHVGYVDGALIYDLVRQNDKKVSCGSIANLTKPTNAMHIILEVYRNNELIGRSVATKSNVQSCGLACITPPVDIGASDDVYARYTCFYNDNDTLKAGYVTRKLELEDSVAVLKTECADPNKKPECKGYKGLIAVSYGRTSSKEEVDYPEIEGRKAGQPQPVFLEGNGTVHLNRGYTFVSYKSHDLSMSSKERGVIPYSGKSPTLTPDAAKTSFTWALDRVWNEVIPNSVQFGTAPFYYDLDLVFTCKDPKGNEIEQNIEVTSFLDKSPLPNIVAIFPLLLLWGCIAKGETVLMADKSEKNIEDVRPGDSVKTPDGSAKVLDVFSGFENEITVIETEDDRKIKLTSGHPILTEAGFKRPHDVLDNKIKMTDGTSVPVKHVYQTDYNGTVYNLALEGSPSFECSGFIVGSLDTQNSTLPGEKRSAHASPALHEELARIAKDAAAETIFSKVGMRN